MSGIVARASYRFGACGRRRGTGTSSDGALALAAEPRRAGSRVAARSAPSLPSRRCLHPPGTHLHVRRRRAETAAARRKRRLVGLLLLAAVALITLLLTAFGSRGTRAGHRDRAGARDPAPALRAAAAAGGRDDGRAPAPAADRPEPRDRDRLPRVRRRRARARPGRPPGATRASSAASRSKLFGGGADGLRYYELEGGTGPQTAALDVGAAAGTDVYSPVDGTIVGITPYVLDGQGLRLADRHPAERQTRRSSSRSRTCGSTRALTVGSSVGSTTSKIGTVLDFSGVEGQALARYTQDAGNHVAVEVHPAAALASRRNRPEDPLHRRRLRRARPRGRRGAPARR